MTERLDQLRKAQPDADITVDYTGGTKSMSAAAMLAVTLRTGIKLQLTVGQRSDLVRVVDGTQQATGLATDRIAIDRQVDLLRAVWRQYGYQEAADGFGELVAAAANQPGVTTDLRDKLKFWHRVGRAFAAWDRFDRTGAADLTHPSRGRSDELKRFGELATLLRDGDKAGTSAPLVLFDLLRNAERCAARGRYDDAVARCYRLWEWTVQWLLRADSDIDTGNVDGDSVPPKVIEGHQPNKKGRFQIGSFRAWMLYCELHPTGGASHFWEQKDAAGKTNSERYRALCEVRNLSILAHGSRRVSQGDSQKILAWTAGPFIDMVRAEARRLNRPDDMPQLPTELPEFVLTPGRE